MSPYESKLQEAGYFFEQMLLKSENSREEFGHCLKAFLSSARSVLQYGLTETKKTAHNKNYIDLLAQYPIVQFFKNIRDEDVHEKPVTPKIHVSTLIIDIVQATGGIALSEEDEKRWADPDYEPTQPETRLVETVESNRVDYYFNNWPGPETVIGLCSGYLEVIKRIVATAMSAGYIGVHGTISK